MSAPIESLRTGRSMTAPTPQNTPANPAPISGKTNPMPSIGEGQEPSVIGQSEVQELIDTLNKSSHDHILDITKLPSPIHDRLRGLKSIQKEHRRLEAEFQQEVLRLEKAYFNKFCPLYAKRHEIVAGLAEPTADEIEAGKEDEEPVQSVEHTDQKSTSSIEDIKGIPSFWLTVLKKRDSFAAIITEKDEAVLSKLIDIRLEYLETPGFRIIFDFGDPEKNEFFTNRTLTKTYHYQKDLGYSGSFIYDHADGDEIFWRSGHNLANRFETRTQRNRTTRQTRTILRTIPMESFFHFFAVPNANLSDNGEPLDRAYLEELLEEDYQRGEDLKEKLIPHAIDWFTGKALLYESSLDDLDYDEDGLFSDEVEEEEEDSEEEDQDTNGKPKAEAAECKQS